MIWKKIEKMGNNYRQKMEIMVYCGWDSKG